MDKREAVRVPVRVRAQCRAEDVVIDGTVEDISRSGVFFRGRSAMAEGSSTEIQLDLPGESSVQLMATVVRVDRSGMGLRFVGEAERSRRPLANFIMRCHATH
jgi:hypothetical protein